MALPGEGVRFFLVETADPMRLRFTSLHNGVAHGVIDFYVPDLDVAHASLKARGVDVENLSTGAFGFGFQDLDGNKFGVHRDRGSFEHRRDHPTR
jgi:hypothetical protein